MTFCHVFDRDGKIIVHYRSRDYSVEYYGHNQEVNCIDCRGEFIISGSRDKTAKVRKIHHAEVQISDFKLFRTSCVVKHLCNPEIQQTSFILSGAHDG